MWLHWRKHVEMMLVDRLVHITRHHHGSTPVITRIDVATVIVVIGVVAVLQLRAWPRNVVWATYFDLVRNVVS